MKLFLLQTLVLGALATMDGGYSAKGKGYADGKDKGMPGYGRPMEKSSNGMMQGEKKDGMTTYSGGKDKGMRDYRMPMEKSNAMLDEEQKKKKQIGQPATPDIIVIGQNWADGKGEMKMNPPSPGGKIITVIVGGGELIYTPDTVTAAIGDKINFVFMAKNHTVTQSTFEKPCVKMPMGVDSGFMPNDGTMNPPPSFMFEVKTMAPTWFYCKQRTGMHCGKGMVFSLNPTAEKSAGKFKEMALQQNGTAVASGSTMASSSTMPVDVTMSTTTSSIINAAGGTTPMTTTTTTTPAATPTATTSTDVNLVQGSGRINDAGACDCTCMCGTAAFPPGAGLGNWGGFGGAMPAQWDSVPAAPGAKVY